MYIDVGAGVRRSLSITLFLRRFLPQLGAAGFSGVISYPTIIRFDGKIRCDLESVGLDFPRKVEMIAMARERYRRMSESQLLNGPAGFSKLTSGGAEEQLQEP